VESKPVPLLLQAHEATSALLCQQLVPRQLLRWCAAVAGRFPVGHNVQQQGPCCSAVQGSKEKAHPECTCCMRQD